VRYCRSPDHVPAGRHQDNVCGKVANVSRDLATQLVDARNQRLEVVAVFQSGISMISLSPSPSKPMALTRRIVVVVVNSADAADQLVQELIYIDPRLLLPSAVQL